MERAKTNSGASKLVWGRIHTFSLNLYPRHWYVSTRNFQSQSLSIPFVFLFSGNSSEDLERGRKGGNGTRRRRSGKKSGRCWTNLRCVGCWISRVPEFLANSRLVYWSQWSRPRNRRSFPTALRASSVFFYRMNITNTLRQGCRIDLTSLSPKSIHFVSTWIFVCNYFPKR